ENQQTLAVSYSTGFKKFTITYNADFYGITKFGYLNVLLSGTEHFTTRYFGYGNETGFDKKLEFEDFYNVNQELLIIRPILHYNLSSYIRVNIGMSVIQTETTLNNDTILYGAKFNQYGLHKLNSLGIHVGIELNNIENKNFPQTGYSLKIFGSVFPAIFNVPKSFESVDIDFRTFITSKILPDITIAIRTGGRKVWGKYPFFAGATLGGRENLRGYLEKRFTGDASVFGQFELRNHLTDLKLILKGKLGLLAFIEAGRVFAANENSKRWHPAYGVGAWLSYLNAGLILTTYIAFSPESTIFSFGFELPF
ncbi:MAG: BamA/TamA family outer membrane protein, partial [Ignavibacteria bacterium]|nr:BamA/TamA family outer membrane protein [Ignavibacteria bacterium]